MNVTLASFFSGMGGFDLAFQRAGISASVQVEIDGECRRLLGKRFNALVIDDVRKIAAVHRRMRLGKPGPDYENWKRLFALLRSAAVWCGGFPCQDLSVAGARAGLAGERSGLWYAFRRLIALFRPSWLVIENVPGLLSSQGGGDLAIVLSGLAQLGYWWSYRIFDAQYAGLAQRRERVFIVASFGTDRCAEVLFESESVCWDSPPRRETREGLAPGVAGSLGGSSQSGGFRTTDLDNQGAFIPEVVGALNDGAHNGGGLNGQDAYTGRIIPAIATALTRSPTSGGSPNEDSNLVPEIAPTVSTKWAKGTGGYAGQNECENMVLGMPPLADPISTTEGKSFTHEGKGNFRLRNVVPILEAGARTGKSTTDKRAGMGVGEEGDPMFTLQSGKQHAVAFKASHFTRDKDGAPSDVTPPLSADADKGDQDTLVAFDTTQVTSKTNRSNPQPGDPCHTIARGAQPPCIAFSSKDHGADMQTEMSPTLRAMGHKDTHANGGGQVAIAFQTRIARNGRGQPEEICPALNGSDAGATSDMRPVVAIPTAVRRLTPLECLRLQGYPDDWLDHLELSDSTKYKMCGNAVAVPCVEWIADRIAALLQ